jgi:hypothetical protein
MIGSLCAEKLIPGENPGISNHDVFTQDRSHSIPRKVDRRPLSQALLGDSDTWAQVLNRNAKRSRKFGAGNR